MPRFRVRVDYSCTQYGRAWLEVDADDEDDALEAVKKGEHDDISYKADDSDGYKWDWEDAEIEEV